MRKPSFSLLIAFIFIIQISSLKLHHLNPQHLEVQSQLEALRAQQSSFENSVNKIIQNLTAVEKKVNATQNTSQKVILLENAILSERQEIFNLQNTIIPAFNLSKTACKQLTNDQKIHILDQIASARIQVSKLKNISSKIPECAETSQINLDIQKQNLLLDSIEKIIYTQCKSTSILGPTIFQTNLYAGNWIIGNQTFSDIVDQYTERSIKYENVTNCPIQTPFFTGKSCINCTGANPIFNMFSKKCESCPQDTVLDINTKYCVQQDHYTDYSSNDNWAFDGASSLPVINSSLTPCNSPKYWNGSCVTCNLPSYWSVKDNKCKKCQGGQVFDVNQKKCTKPNGALYTVLEGTNWVTNSGNITKVLEDRAKLLNGTDGSTLPYCSDDLPYFDGIDCVSCPNQFNLDTNKCTSPPQGTVYDENVHAYIVPEKNKQTNSSAPNLLSSSPPLNTNTPDCNSTHPYYDGIACIKCQSPFILFDTQTKKCCSCDISVQYYNSTLRSCVPRQKIYISTNMNNLLATKSKTIADYKSELINKINSTEGIIYLCDNTQAYSNYSSCFTCKTGESFNIQTKKCETCNGTIDPSTNICVPKKTLLTNLTANNLLLSGNKTIADFQKEQSSITGPTQICPIDAPYSPDGIVCIPCLPPNSYYDLENKICSNCIDLAVYSPTTKKCIKSQLVSNVDAFNKSVSILQVDNYTISNIKAKIQEINKTQPITACPWATPIYNGTKCVGCPNPNYFNLKTNQCLPPLTVTNTNTTVKNYAEIGNYTMANLNKNISNSIIPTVPCNISKPYYNGVECMNCPANTLFNLKYLICQTPKLVSNVSALSNLPNVIQHDNNTIDDLANNISKLEYATVECDSAHPDYNGSACYSCSNDTYYNIKYHNCTKTKLVTNVNALATSKNYLQNGNYTLAKLNETIQSDTDPKIVCSDKKPLFNGTACISCLTGQQYDLKNLNCSGTLINTTNVTNTNCSIGQIFNKTINKCVPKPIYYANLSNPNWIVADSATADNIINYTLTLKKANNSQECPQGKQFYNNITKQCVSCPNGTLYSYDSNTCIQCTSPLQINVNTHKCSKKSTGQYITSLQSSNLTYGGLSIQQLRDNYNSTVTQYPKIQNCTSPQPYFDGYECIKCNNYTPYFNLVTLKCMNCPFNTTYSDKLHECCPNNTAVPADLGVSSTMSSIF